MYKDLVLSLIFLISLALVACEPISQPGEIVDVTIPAPTAGDDQPTQVLPSASPTAPPVNSESTPASKKPGYPDADVIAVRAVLESDGIWTFHVTVQHPDTGWDDYTDGWDLVTPDGTVLKPNPDDPFTRLLLHPHEAEQPFTRSQHGIQIPDGVTLIRVRAHDMIYGFGGREILVDLTQDTGSGFTVER